MSIIWQGSALTAESLSIRIRSRLRNVSKETWSREKGFALGCQILDGKSGEYVGESEWLPLAADVPPGAEIDVELTVALPEEPGTYRLIVSPIENGVRWRYLDNWPVLIAEAEVENQKAVLLGSRVATQRRLRVESLPRSVLRAFRRPVATIWRNAGLIRSMVRRDIAARYRGSLGDVLWTVLHPLLLMATYFFVFGIVLQTRFAGDPSREGFVLYFLAGMLPWLAFSEAVGRSPFVILEHRSFVKKLLFPVEILPVNLVISGLVSELFALGVFLGGLFFFRGEIPITVLWLPVILIPQVLLTAGLCWFLASLGVYLRDLGQVIGFALTLLFFLTPICYPEASIPEAIAPLLKKNPIYQVVLGYRTIFLEAKAPSWPAMWKLWILSCGAFVLGHACFHKLRKSFADVT